MVLGVGVVEGVGDVVGLPEGVGVMLGVWLGEVDGVGLGDDIGASSLTNTTADSWGDPSTITPAPESARAILIPNREKAPAP